jgi:hypothetical protein
MFSKNLQELLKKLEAVRSSCALIYATHDQANPPRQMEAKDIIALFDCLRLITPVNRVDLILHTGGGEVQTARKMVHLLREMANELHVLVPHKARSAGTLLCMGADQVVMGRLGELSPIDPHISLRGDIAGNGPKAISAEEIRLFYEMARNWFGVEENGTDLLVLLGQKFFPTTLSTFYRATQQMCQVARELLAWQHPSLADGEIAEIVHRLMHGYHSHDAFLNWQDAQEAGLRARLATETER